MYRLLDIMSHTTHAWNMLRTKKFEKVIALMRTNTLYYVLMQDLETSEQQRKQLEKEHISSVSRLREREEEIRQLHKV